MRVRSLSVSLCALTVSVAAFGACGPASKREPDAGPADAPCPTSISGKVFAPNGTLPLFGAVVYVPGNAPAPFVEGVQCSQCSTLVPADARTSATTDAAGTFRLEGVPTDGDFPVIVQVGKWRRQVTIPKVAQCQDTPVADGTIRLPRNRSEGEIPRIAVVTGACDALACVLTKMGIDSSEFGDSASDPQRIVFFNGAGGSAPGTPEPAARLWSNLNELKKFDVVLNSCECSEHNENKGAPMTLKEYADIGGRVLGSHYQYTWQKNLVPDWRATANWDGGSAQTPDLVDMSFPKGQAFAQWLVAIGASTTLGQIELDVKTYDAAGVGPMSQRWLHSSGANPTTHYMSFDTPVGAPSSSQCGKVVYAGMHVSTGNVGTDFPMGCSDEFTPDEKALTFLLFDLQSCLGTIL